MPDYLLDNVINKIDFPLKDRWSLGRISLDFITKGSQTANELIRKIWELHEVAGYKLSSNSDSAINSIKNSLYNKLRDDRTPATMRHLIPTIIKIIQIDWTKKN